MRKIAASRNYRLFKKAADEPWHRGSMGRLDDIQREMDGEPRLADARAVPADAGLAHDVYLALRKEIQDNRNLLTQILEVISNLRQSGEEL
jgi:hypothetical protein